MTILKGKFTDVARETLRGTVQVYAVATRRGTADNTEVVTRQVYQDVLRDGVFTTPELDPGPVIVELRGSGVFEKWQVVLPATGTHELAELLEEVYEYTPEVVAAAQTAARDADSKLSAVVVQVEQAKKYAGAALQAKDKAETAAHEAAQARSMSNSHMGATESAKKAAERAKTAAEEFAGKAETKASEAEAAASRAEDTAQNARLHSDSARTQSNKAVVAAVQAEEAAKKAKVGAPPDGWGKSTLSKEVRDLLEPPGMPVDLPFTVVETTAPGTRGTVQMLRKQGLLHIWFNSVTIDAVFPVPRAFRNTPASSGTRYVTSLLGNTASLKGARGSVSVNTHGFSTIRVSTVDPSDNRDHVANGYICLPTY